MDAVAVALVVTSAVIHAGWNLIHHRAEDRLAVIAFAYTAGGLALVPAAVIDPPTEAAVWIAVTVVFHTGYQYLLSTAFERGALSVTYPVARGVSPFLVTAGGWLWLDQEPSATTVAGVAAITLGLLALAHLGHRLTQLDAVGYALLTGVAITGYSLVDARGVQDASPLAYFAVAAPLAGIALIIVARVRAARLRAVWRVGAVVGAAQTGSYVLVLLAFERSQAGQVASLRQLSVVIGVLLAGEMARRRAIGAATLIAAGAMLLTL